MLSSTFGFNTGFLVDLFLLNKLEGKHFECGECFGMEEWMHLFSCRI